jgi:flap endonuclease-1
MGIKNLGKLIRKYASCAIDVCDVSTLTGTTIAIDTSIVVYKLHSVGKCRNIVNARGKPINHIQGVFYRTAKFLSVGIKPVYVFDGAPPAMKRELLQQRRVARDAGKAVKLPSGIFQEVRDVLAAMGVAHVQAPGEAEAQMAALAQTGFADSVSTEDLDALVFGANTVVMGLDATSKTVSVVSRDKLLHALGLTAHQFVDLCILLGCDYTGTIPGIGMVNALNLIQKHKSIEMILKHNLFDVSKCDFVGARKTFLGTPVKLCKPSEGRLDPKLLENLLVNAHGLDIKRVEKVLKTLTKHAPNPSSFA